MRRSAPIALLVLLIAANTVGAETLPAGSVYGTTDGCDAVASGTYPASDDWAVVTPSYLRQHESVCHFVQTLPDKDGELFINAVCAGEGENWPASFVIVNGENDEIVLSSTSEGNPWQIHLCEGQTDAAADKLFGE